MLNTMRMCLSGVRRQGACGFVPRSLWLLSASLLLAASLAQEARSNDSGSIQITIPTPDPVMAGEAVTFQTLGVNTGRETWIKGSYYWEAQIYDLEYNYLGRTDSVFPQEDTAAGAVSSALIRFEVPETWLGRKFYKVFLVHNGQRVADSDYRPFQVTERAVQPPPPQPPVEKYKVGGNVTLGLSQVETNGAKKPSGATTANLVGKLSNSSFLFNSYFLHDSRRFIDPIVLLFVYYAPWGTVSLGDISPELSPLSVYGQGLRGAMLDQATTRIHWTLLGGQEVPSTPGNLTTNGRYQRLLFGAKGEVEVVRNLKLHLDYVLGFDDTSSLSSDPNSTRFRGPTLTPQKNPVMGGGLSWTPGWRLTFLGDYQRSSFQADATSSAGAVSDTAWRGEARWEPRRVKVKAWVQRAGTKFRSFGAPAVIPDRLTYDGALGLFPASWWNIQASLNQYRDNLASSSTTATTTQRNMNAINTLVLPTQTTLSASYSVNTVRANPSTAQDNQTVSMGANISQSLRGQSLNVGYQTSEFKDKNRLSHDLSFQTLNLNTTLSLFGRLTAALGTTQSTTKDKIDSTKRTSQSFSASFGVAVVPKRLNAQLWGSMDTTKNNSLTFPSDQKTTSIKTEWTYSFTPQSALAVGGGYNKTQDSLQPANNLKQTSATARYSYSF